MGNHYSLLGIDVSVGQHELERLWEEKYNEVRRLVTHHDPQVVEEANHQIRVLENARQILFDPAKRAEYTARLSGQGIAGLGDPTAQGADPAVSTPYSGAVGNSNAVTPPKRLDAWICDNCQEENTIGTKFCSKCGEGLGKNCPKCQSLNRVADVFCVTCGADIKEYEYEQEVAKQNAEKEARIRQMEWDRKAAENAQKERKRQTRGRIISGIILVAIVLGIWSSIRAEDLRKQQRIDEKVYDQTYPNWIGSAIKTEVNVRYSDRSSVSTLHFDLTIYNITYEDINYQFSLEDIFVVDNNGNQYDVTTPNSETTVNNETRGMSSKNALGPYSDYNYFEIVSVSGFDDSVEYFTVYFPKIYGEDNISIVVPVSTILNWDILRE